MSPLEQSIELLKQDTEKIPQLVEIFQQAKGQQKILAAHLIQQTLKTEELIEPIDQALLADVRFVRSIDLLGRLAELQNDPLCLSNPVKSLEQAKAIVGRYLIDTRLSVIAKPRAEAWYQAVLQCRSMDELIRLVHQWFPEWRRYYWAIQDGYIQSPIDVYRWEQSRPLKFRWGKRVLQRMLTKLPPIVPDQDVDPTSRVDLFGQRPIAIVQRGQQ